MATQLSAGKRFAMMVADAGIPEAMLNAVLAPRGFAPVITLSSVGELATRMRQGAPSLVIVPVQNAASSPEFAQLEFELRRSPTVAAIGTAPTKDADTVLAAMRKGVLEFLVTPPNDEELRTAIARVLSLSQSGSMQGKVYAVYSAKGGLGTSTLAASLAWDLAHRSEQKNVALADFTTTGAGVRVMLNLSPLYDLGSISARASQIDRELIRSVLVQHPDGVSILAAAEEVDGAESLDTFTAGKLFDVMRQEYSYSVVDVDHHFADLTLAALDAADRILLVTQLDVSALRSTQRSIGVFVRLGYSPDKVSIVANRRSDRDPIPLADVEKVLGRPVDFILPNDYAACAGAITHGLFVQRFAPTSQFGQRLSAIATSLAGTELDAAESNNGKGERSRLSRLFGRK